MIGISLAGLTAFGDVLTVSSNTTIPAGGATYSGITFTGGYTLSGGKVTLTDENTGITVSAGAATIACEVDVGAGASAVAVSVGSGLSLTIAKSGGVLSGSAPITISGGGTVYSAGASTFTGLLTIDQTDFYARSNGAFGTADGKTCVTCQSNKGRIYFDTLVTGEVIEFTLNDSNTYLYSTANSLNVLNGTVSGRSGRLNGSFGKGSDTTFNGGATKLSYMGWNGVDNTAHVTLDCPVTTARYSFGFGTFYLKDLGTTPTADTGGSYGLNLEGVVIFQRKNIFCASAESTTLDGGGNNKLFFFNSGSGTINLNGCDQIISGFAQSKDNDGNWMDRKTVITSTGQAATLHAENKILPDKSKIPPSYAILFQGLLSLSVEGSAQAMTFTGASTATGDLRLSNGAQVTFGPDATWGGDVSLIGAGTLLTLKNRNFFITKPTIALADGASLKLDYAGSAVVSSLSVGGTVYTQVGTYGGEDTPAQFKIPALQGSGMLLFEPTLTSSHTFNAPKDAADQKISTAGNWVDDNKPVMTTFTEEVVFANQGDRASIDVDAKLYGVRVAIPASSGYMFAPAGGSLSLNKGGLSVTGTSGDDLRAVTNGVPTIFDNDQTWSLPLTNMTCVQKASLSSDYAIEWTKTGWGSLFLEEPGNGLDGVLNWTDGHLHLKNPAALGTMHLKVTKTPSMRVNFYGGVIPNNVSITGGTDTTAFIFGKNTTTEFKGRVSFGSYDRSTYNSGSKVVFAGGVETCSSLRGGFTHLVYTNKSCAIPSFDSNGTKIEIWTTNNTYRAYNSTTWGTFYFYNGGACVELHAPYAINTNLAGNILMPWITGIKDVVFDLCGYDQQIVRLQEIVDASKMPDDKSWTITSAKPAQMKVFQNEDKEVSHLLVTGAAGLTMNGANALTLKSRTCSTTGTLAVERGSLTLGEGARFPKLSAVRVSGGTFAVTAANQLNRRVDLYVSGAGQVSVPDGMTLEVRRLYVNGQSQPLGDYAGGFITGGGTIHVPGGVAIILK